VLRKNLFFIITLLYSVVSLAGARGYNIVIQDLSTSPNKSIYLTWAHDSESLPEGTNKQCWNRRKGIDVWEAYIFTPVPGINKNLAQKIVDNDANSISLARKIMINYKDDTVREGFDGMLIITRDGRSIVSIGSLGGYSTVSFKNNGKKPTLKELDGYFCRALAPLDDGFEP
jgi:hypothetical protein